MKMSSTKGNFTFIESQQGAVDADTLSLIRSHIMRTVRHKKKVEAQRAKHSKRLRKPVKLASKVAPTEVGFNVAKATVKNLDIEGWARRAIMTKLAGYVVVYDGVCPLECVLKRAETLRTCSYTDVLADPGMVDFVNLLLDDQLVRENWPDDGLWDANSSSIELGPLLLAFLKRHQQNSSWSWGISKEMLVQQSMHDIGLFHSFLSMSLASNSGTDTKDKTRQLWHEFEVIKTVRRRLEHLERTGGPYKDSDIWAISLVGLQHAVYGSPDVANLHLHGINQLVSSRGGLATLGFDGHVKYVVELLIAALRRPLLDWVK